MSDFGVRLQDLSVESQVLVLLDAVSRRTDSGRASPADVGELFDDLGLPRPSRIDNALRALERKALASRTSGRGQTWRLTPRGRQAIAEVFATDDVDQLRTTGTEESEGAELARTTHALVPHTFAPIDILQSLEAFIKEHPFDRNVFGMTRFPSEEGNDPLSGAIDVAREVVERHGLELHLASDRAMSDDLWVNVAAHMWASRYGVAFFEDRAGTGINYNLTLEVGAMLMTGRRIALLKDKSVAKLPTDVVGKIYKSVNLDRPKTVGTALHKWVREDLSLGSCADC
jgi:DNA-binding MarR family transcriptional regulator